MAAARDRGGWKLAAVIAAMAIGSALLTMCNRQPLPPDELDAPAALGMPVALRSAGDRPRLVLLTEQHGRRHFWGFANGMRWGKPASEPYRRVDLWAFDENLDVDWRRRLRDDDQSFQLGPYRIAGAAGEGGEHVVVELDRRLVVSAADGAVASGPATDFVPAPWTGFDTRRLLARGVPRGSGWIGVLTDAEVAKLRSPEGRAQGWHPDAFGPPGEDADVYGVWLAHRQADGGIDVETMSRVADAAFPRAGLLVDADGVAPGAGQDAFHVLARGDDGVLSITRFEGPTGTRRWTVALPQTELALAIAGEDTLVMYGHGAPPGTEASALARYGVLTALRAGDGGRTDRAVAGLVAD